MSRSASYAASALLAVALAGAAFGAQGGFDLARVTWTEIALVVAGGVVVAAAVLAARRGRIDGGLTALALAGLVVLCAVSILWSIAPDLSWLETNLTIAYLAVFAASAALARLAPDGAGAVLRAILLAVAAVVLYALATRVWPTLARDDIFARLGEPYGYWNALGATAALGVVPALWLGSRRSGHAPANALAYPLLSLLAITIFLSYSRAAIVVAGLGALAWILFVPLRLRTLVLSAASLATAAPVIVWALHQDAFTKNSLPLSVRQEIAGEFGGFLIATLLGSLVIGLVITFAAARRPPRASARLRMGVAAGAVAVSVPVMLVIVLANSDRGLGGTIRSGYESLTSIGKHTTGGPGRLLSASSSRGLYWHQAKLVFQSHYWKGTGAGTFGVARLRFRERSDQSVSQHAHGFVQQMAADLGTAGLVAALALALLWLGAAARTVGVLRHRRRGPPLGFGAERAALAALALAGIVYGAYSALDWVWFVPGPTVMALAAAGFVAGRGPLTLRAAGAPPTLAGVHPAAARAAYAAPAAMPPPPPPPSPQPSQYQSQSEQSTAVLELPPPPPAPPGPEAPPPTAGPGRRRPLVPERVGRPLLALGTIVAALLAAYAIWQPLRSDQQSDRALDLSANSRYAAALAATDTAHDYDPLTPRPLLVRSAIEDARGDTKAAEQALVTAVRQFPAQPQTWLQLADYQLNTLNQPKAALETIRGALFLDPQSRAAQTVFFQASYRLHPPAGLPAPVPAVPAPGTPNSD